MADRGRVIIIDYTNHAGIRSTRRIRPIQIHFMKNDFHPDEPQWFLEAFALDRTETRMFAMKDVHSWEVEK